MDGFLDVAVSILAATLRVATPLILAALAGLFAERSGVVDVGLEGKMLIGAFAAAATASVTGSVWLGLGAAVLAAAALALLHAVACVTLRGSQVVSGMAINVLRGASSRDARASLVPPGRPDAALPQRALPAPAAAGRELGDIPVLGRLLDRVVGGHTAGLPAFALCRCRLPALAHALRLRWRAAGKPAAVDARGAPSRRHCVCRGADSGVLCGVAGAAISTAQGAGFTTEMTAGRGFIALAALILAHWRPWPVLATCLLFGLLDAVAIRLQGVPVPGLGIAFPVQAMQALPYVLTVVLLAGFVGRAVPPRAAGVPYVKER
jgi:simple sugar transport system permease protein